MPLVSRPLLPDEPDYERWLAVLFPLSWLGAGLLLFVLRLKIPPCPLLHFTGVPCPGCGSTRATVALAHGDLPGAFWFNPLWTLLCLGGVIAWLYCLGVVFRKKNRWRLDTPAPRELWLLRIGTAVLLASNWLWVLFRELNDTAR